MKFRNRIYESVAKVWVFVFARPRGQFLNNAVFQLALRGSGYNNCCDVEKTGEAKLLTLLSNLTPSLAIDVGANVGNYSREILVRTSATVLAFEPLPMAASKASALSLQYPGRFLLFREAVGSRVQAQVPLFAVSEDSELATLSEEVLVQPGLRALSMSKIAVDVTTLDSAWEMHISGKFSSIDLLKIDTEGWEREVLVGAERLLREMPPKFIQIEFNWHQLFRNQTLLDLSKLLPGYAVFQLLPFGSGLVRRDLDKPESNVFHYSNFVFVREDVAEGLNL